MKILITTGIFPPEIGGPARMVEQLALDLHFKGIAVIVLTFGKDDCQARPYKIERASGKLDFFRKILGLSKETDIIYTFDLYTAGFFSWLVGKKLLGKKLIVRFAGDSAWETAYNKGLIKDDIITFQEKNYGLKITWLKKMRSCILRGADKVVAVSQFMKGIAEKIGVPAERIEVIYNSVDFVKIKTAHVRNLRVERGWPNHKIIVTAGRLVPWKGIDLLINAFAELKKDASLAPIKLLIVGGGPDSERLEKIVEKIGMVEEVLFAGRQPLEDIFIYYQAADVFVLNSQYEGLSHVLLEALSVGTPIIASRCGGNPEVIEDGKNGLLVDYKNVEQLKSAIKRILTEPYWQSVEHKNACQESLKKFNWQNVIDQTLNVFNEVMIKHE